MRLVDLAETRIVPFLNGLEKQLIREMEPLRAKFNGYETAILLKNERLILVKDFILSEHNVGHVLIDGSKLLMFGYMDVVVIGDCYHLYKQADSFGFTFSLNRKTVWDRPYTRDFQPKKSFFIVDEAKNMVLDVSQFICQGDPRCLDFFQGGKDTIVFDPKVGEVGMFIQGRFYPIEGGNTILHPFAKFILENCKNV